MNAKKTLFYLFFFLAVGALWAQPAVNKSSAAQKTFYVLIETDYGSMKVQLYNETPQHRDNFLKLVREGFYDGLLFHRVISGFMIQGGDPLSRNAKPGQPLGNGNLTYRVPAEFVPALFHRKGALAAARLGDAENPLKESSASQFYIVQGSVYSQQDLSNIAKRMGKTFSAEQQKVYTTIGGTPFLDGDYTVFGQVVEGLEVIDKIAAVQCGYYDRPVKDVRMKIKIVEE